MIESYSSMYVVGSSYRIQPFEGIFEGDVKISQNQEPAILFVIWISREFARTMSWFYSEGFNSQECHKIRFKL